MTSEQSRRGPEPSMAALAVILIVGGGILLAAQLMDVDLGRIGWPFFVIAPGAVLLVAGLASAGGVGLTIAGSIVTIVGLILFFQNSTGLYATWAYAWALTGPFGAGLGMVLHGMVHRQPNSVRDGLWPMLTGLGLFLVGFVFFEGIIGISGDRLDLPGWALPAVLILGGLGVLAWSMTGRRTPFDDD
jgi:hypothetical protein